jgi:hemolysin activation/secretion protein
MIPWKKAYVSCTSLAWLALQTLLAAADASPSVAPEAAAAVAASPTVTTPVAPAPDSAVAPATPATGRPLRRIIIAESIEVLQAISLPPNASFVVLTPVFGKFDLAELGKRLTPGENRPIDERLLAAIAQVTENFFRQREYPSATAIIPSQNIGDGTVRVILNLGTQSKSVPLTGSSELKIRNINMKGTKWFSESLLRQKLQIEKDQVVRISDLEQAIGWTNNNPFRRVHVKLDQVPNTSEADLTIVVQDSLPLKFVATYDNGGNATIGDHRFVGAVSYANMWGLDHTLSYQYITSDQPRVFKAHGLDYRVPLPWRHYVSASASILNARPTFFGGAFAQDAETITADLRYTVPVRTGDNSLEAFAAINFKESNNNLAFGGTAVQATKTDIFQLTTGFSAVRRDKRGAWAFGFNLTLSPGGINGRNTDRAFDTRRFDITKDSSRPGARAGYIYGSISVQRLVNLMPAWDFMARGVAQLSQANLLPSEQLNIGGASTVRGFNENTSGGDHGFVMSGELLAPSWKKALPYLSKTRGPLEIRPLGFIDAGKTSVYKKDVSDQPHVALAGAGIGLRASLSTNFSFTADYGWQITNLPFPQAARSNAHLKATLAF